MGKLASHETQTAYNQTFKAMVEKGHIAINEGKIWFCDKEGSILSLIIRFNI